MKKKLSIIILILILLTVGVGFQIADNKKKNTIPLPAVSTKQANGDMKNHDTMTQKNIVIIDPMRLQSIGVTYEPAKKRLMDKVIKTVGRIEVDERELANVNVKFEGWIEKLFVNFTGETVKRGQPLFSIYSPELVATQHEYLLALKSRQSLGKSPYPEVSQGAITSLKSAHQRLSYWDISEADIQRLTRTGQPTKTLTISSPITGTVINKNAFIGMKVEPGLELYRIANLSKLWVLADIYEYELPFIKTKQNATVTLSYLPKQTFTAIITFIYPTVDTKTRTALVRFELDNRKDIFKPGMYANIELNIPLGNLLVVSKDAILETGERSVVFIYLGDGKITWRNVQIGHRIGNWVEVLQGISEGELVITSANFLIDSESQLKAAMDGMKH